MEVKLTYDPVCLSVGRLVSLKGQVTFLKLCLLLVCLALNIPRFVPFLLTTVFRLKNAFICLCQHRLFCQRRPVYAGTVIEVMVFSIYISYWKKYYRLNDLCLLSYHTVFFYLYFVLKKRLQIKWFMFTVL